MSKRTPRPASIVVPLLCLGMAACVHVQQSTRFSGPASLTVEEVAKELVVCGHEPAVTDVRAGLVQTRWEDTGFLYGFVQEREASIFRRYTVTLTRGAADTSVAVRADVKRCPKGAEVSANNELRGACERLDGLVEQHQSELDALGARLHKALAVSPGHPRTARMRLAVVVFDIRFPAGMLQPDSVEQLTEYLATRLAETGLFAVVPRDELRKLLDAEKKRSYEELYSPEFQIELGRAVAAEKSLATRVLEVGDGCTVTARLYDLKTETAEQAAAVKAACSTEAMPAALDELTRLLVDRVRR